MFCIAWRVLLLLRQDHGMVTVPFLAASSHVCIFLTLSSSSSPLTAASRNLPVFPQEGGRKARSR